VKKILWLAILLLPLTATAEDSIDCTFVGGGMQCTLVLDDTFNAISVLEGEQAVQNDRIDELDADCKVGDFTPGRWLMSSGGVEPYQMVFWFDAGALYVYSAELEDTTFPTFAYPDTSATAAYVDSRYEFSVPSFIGSCKTPPAGIVGASGWYVPDDIIDYYAREYDARRLAIAYSKEDVDALVARIEALENQ